MAKRRDSRQRPTFTPRRPTVAQLPQALPVPEGCRRILAFVEGYEDVAFWRTIFAPFESDEVRFDVSVPLRGDLAKGKKVLLKSSGSCHPNLVMCMDSDFDYLFADQTEDAQTINSSPYLFHTYAYSIENYLCYAPSLHDVCVRATKNDAHIFDFEAFFEEYSRTIYPAFVWYAYSAQISTPNIFTLTNFKNTVRLGYLDIDQNGADTLRWLRKQVDRRIEVLTAEHPEVAERLGEFEILLHNRGVTPEQTYLFMHGHTLMDNVVMVVLDAVCSKLKLLATDRINRSEREGIGLTNELSNYNNSLCNVREALLFNENYKECFLYRKLQKDIENFLQLTK